MPSPDQRYDDVARRFHEAYERLAPEFGYETRPESAVPWERVPERNRALMIAVVSEVLGAELDRVRAENDRMREEVEAFRDEVAAKAASPRERGWIADYSIRKRLDQILGSGVTGG